MSRIYNKNLLKKLARKLNKPEKYIREQISKRAGTLGVLPETSFALWLMENKISSGKYVKGLNADTRSEIQRNKSLTTKIIKKTISVGYNKKTVNKNQSLPYKQIPLILSEIDIKCSEKNSKYYRLIYLMENSTRKFIEYFLEQEYGKNWWTHSNGNKAVVRRKIKDDLRFLQNFEENNPINAARGVNKLDYTDFSDLADIIDDNKNVFDSVCISLAGNSTFISQILRRLAPTRNTVAHMGIVPPTDSKRLELDWLDMYKAYRRISDTIINK